MGEGSGGVAGFAKGSALIRVQPSDGGRLSYEAVVDIGGKLASLGERLFRSIVVRNIDSFFDALREVCSKQAPEVGA